MSLLVSDGAPDSEEGAAVLPDVRLGAFVIVLEPAADVRDADSDAEFDDSGAEEAEDAELVAEGEFELDAPIEPSTLLMFSEAAADVGCAELTTLAVLDDMSLPESDGYTT